MKFTRRIRVSALWLVLPGWLLIFVFLLIQLESTSLSGSFESAVASSTLMMIISCTVSSVSSAVIISRLRRSGVLNQLRSRGIAVTVVESVWPAFVSGVLVQCAALLVFLSMNGWVTGKIPWLLFIAQGSMLLFHTFLGAVMGAVLPGVIAPAATVIISMFWLGYLWAFEYAPLRYLSGLALSQCCGLDQSINGSAVFATIQFSFLGAIALLLILISRFSLHHAQAQRVTLTFAGFFTLVLATALGISTAQHVGYLPVVQRSPNDMSCVGADPEVCYFYELDANEWYVPLVQQATDNIRASGIEVPTKVMTTAPPEGYGSGYLQETVYMAVSTRMTPSEALYSYSKSFFSIYGVANCDSSEDYELRFNASTAAQRWLAERASEGIAEPFVSAGGAVGAEFYNALESLPEREQLAWMRHTLGALGDCTETVKAP